MALSEVEKRYKSQWRKSNRDKENSYKRKHREKNKEHINARKRELRALKPEHHKMLQRKSRERNLEAAKVTAKKSRLKNADKVRTANRNRDAIKRAAQGTHTQFDIEQLLADQHNLCNGCRKQLIIYHVDHIFPLSRGGSNWPENLQCLCPSCNISKGSKTMDEWMFDVYSEAA